MASEAGSAAFLYKPFFAYWSTDTGTLALLSFQQFALYFVYRSRHPAVKAAGNDSALVEKDVVDAAGFRKVFGDVRRTYGRLLAKELFVPKGDFLSFGAMYSHESLTRYFLCRTP